MDVSLEREILKRPSYLIQGAELSYARLNYLIFNKVTLDHKGFNYLILSGNNFLKRFGISNDEVKEEYAHRK